MLLERIFCAIGATAHSPWTARRDSRSQDRTADLTIFSVHHETRFCRSFDGVGLAYAIDGNGPPVVKASNWMTHLDYERQSPVWRHWVRELSRGRTLIRFDERPNRTGYAWIAPAGAGRSQVQILSPRFDAEARTATAYTTCAGTSARVDNGALSRPWRVQPHVTRVYLRNSQSRRNACRR